MKSQVRLVDRAGVCRSDRLCALDAFYMTEDDPGLHNVEMMTEAGESMAGTAFTRYTAAPSTFSKRSK